MLPTAFLAQASSAAVTHSDKLDASNPTFAYAVWAVILGGVVTAVMTMDRIDSMLQRRKRSPSVDVDLVGLSTAITTLTQTVEELKAAKDHHNGHKERIAALETKCTELKSQLDREISTQRSYVAKTSKDIFDRIESVEKSVSKNFQEVERGLGRVEGSLGQIAQAVTAAQQAAAAAQQVATAAQIAAASKSS